MNLTVTREWTNDQIWVKTRRTREKIRLHKRGIKRYTRGNEEKRAANRGEEELYQTWVTAHSTGAGGVTTLAG